MAKSMKEDEMFTIREERHGEAAAIRALHESAFQQPTEAAIVDQLRSRCPQRVSIVATERNRIVGHLLFSPAGFDSTIGMGLAPMAVLPEFQRRGIGSALVRSGIGQLEEQGVPFIVVLGHPQFYRKFGFVPGSNHAIQCQWPGIPEEAFLIRILDRKIMEDRRGTIFYREEFNSAV